VPTAMAVADGGAHVYEPKITDCISKIGAGRSGVLAEMTTPKPTPCGWDGAIGMVRIAA
jgi:hypothetical protein